MLIRVATMQDVADAVALEREVETAPHWSEGSYRGIVEGHGPQRCLLVAEDQGGLMGFGVGRVVADEGDLESVVVGLGWRRRGVGQALCCGVIGWAWEMGAERIDLEVRASSKGAIALYGGLGFAERCRRRSYYAEPVEDAVLMRLERPGVLNWASPLE